MPIYEYECKSCAKIFSILKLSSSTEKVLCAHCGSDNVQKKISSFACSCSSGGSDFSGFSGGSSGGHAGGG